ncbi:MFS transporter [Candidatus Micrarchaeota archaeon]|nr:MFS transporter [Candidatus Micrarchaeota archaeon]
MMRRIGAMNFINEFSYASLVLALPLYLISRGMEVEEIGLVLSLLPFAFILVRVSSALIADVFGVKAFFIANGLFNAVTAGIYAFAATPLQFGMGKLSQGAASAFFWTVDRTAIMARAHKRSYLMLMSGVREFGAGLGIICAGALIAFFSFESLFGLLAVLGVVSAAVALSIVNRGATLKKPEWKSVFRINGREFDFWQVSAATVFVGASFKLLFVFLLPLLMSAWFGMGYLEVAVMLAAFYLCMGAGGFLSVRIGEGKLSLLVQLAAIPFIIFLPFDGGFFSIALMATGLGFGVCFGINEALFGYLSKKEEGMSSKFAVLLAPVNFTEFLVLALSGFALNALGIEALFLLSALLLLASIVLSKKIIGDFEGTKKLISYRPHKGPAAVAARR